MKKLEFGPKIEIAEADRQSLVDFRKEILQDIDAAQLVLTGAHAKIQESVANVGMSQDSRDEL